MTARSSPKRGALSGVTVARQRNWLGIDGEEADTSPIEKIPAITVRVDATGALLGVEVEGQSEPAELIESVAVQAVGPFGDEVYKARVRPWPYA